MTDPDGLTTGSWWVAAPCPKCGEISEIALRISPVATFPEEGTPSLGLKCSSKKIDHQCGSQRVSAAAGQGEQWAR